MKHTVPKLNDPSLLKKNVAYINGEWVAAKSGKTFEVNGASTAGFRPLLTRNHATNLTSMDIVLT